MTPRPATATDWRSILTLLEGSNLPTTDLSTEHVARFRVVYDGLQLAGCVAVEQHGDWGLLRSLAVAPEMRGRGLGTVLVSAALDFAKGEGLTDLALLTDTAEPFFRSLGWRRVSRDDVPEAVRQSSEFQGTCCACAACLVRPVQEGTSISPA